MFSAFEVIEVSPRFRGPSFNRIAEGKQRCPSIRFAQESNRDADDPARGTTDLARVTSMLLALCAQLLRSGFLIRARRLSILSTDRSFRSPEQADPKAGAFRRGDFCQSFSLHDNQACSSYPRCLVRSSRKAPVALPYSAPNSKAESGSWLLGKACKAFENPARTPFA